MAVSSLAAEAKQVRSKVKRPKVIIVLFGGGTRYSESIGDPTHKYIPHLWNDMVPRGTLFTDMRVEHKVVHPNSAGSIVTGHWEWDDLDWSRPVANPTIFEIYRKQRKAPDTKAWAFVYASILSGSALSRAPDYGKAFAANTIEPPTISRAAAEKMNKLMNESAATGSIDAGISAARKCAALARSESTIARGGLRSDSARRFLDSEYSRWRKANGSTSHDEFLTDCAIACMRRFSPEVITVMYGEIDCAHYGSWSRYTEAIQQTDRLTYRLWKAVQELPDYSGQTLMLILPDHGRELERAGGSGFIHHSDFYTNTGADAGCRRVWMLALGPDVKPGKTVSRRVPITAVAATALHHLELSSPPGSEASILSLTR